MLQKFIVVTLFVSIYLLSCSKVPCYDTNVEAFLHNFDSTDLSLVLLKKYSANSNFTSLLNTKVFIYDTSNKTSNDTTYNKYYPNSYPHNNDVLSLNAGYDWKIELPIIGKTYKLTNVSFDQVKRKISNGGSGFCTNDLSYNLDGKNYVITGESTTGSGANNITSGISINK